MDVFSSQTQDREAGSGFSVVVAEKVLAMAKALKWPEEWDRIGLGHPSKRVTAYTPAQRISAIVAGLACGLRGISSGNMILRPNSAIAHFTGSRFPDQGTIHRWLAQVTDKQAAALRSHMHQAVRDQGRFRDLLRSGVRLMVDVDGQGLIARGGRFEQANYGRLGNGFDHGYQRYVAYAGQTQEVLDEFLRPGTSTLLTELPELVKGLCEVFAREWRHLVVVRADSHGGTVNNIIALENEGFSYLLRMQAHLGIERLKSQRCREAGQTFKALDSKKTLRDLTYWDVPDWTIHGDKKKGQRDVRTRAVVYCEKQSSGEEEIWVLLTTLPDVSPPELWSRYHERSGMIEEYNDQSERSFHLEVKRTGHLAGLQALHALMCLCWNATVWVAEKLELPPPTAPQAERNRWKPATSFDRSALLERGALSGLRLFRRPGSKCLEVEDTVHSPESAAWMRWLGGGIQIRLHLLV